MSSLRFRVAMTGRDFGSNPNVGTFVSHEKEHVRKSLNALSVLNGSFDNLCAGRWFISCLFVTTNG
jgi:hypothetical protein